MASHDASHAPSTPGVFLSTHLASGEAAASFTGNPFNFASAILLGFTYGLLHIVGPDHLGTLISLSAAATPQRAFSVGAAWSLGHCAGMVLVGFLVIALRKVMHVDVDAWEHVGEYVVGLSMILCGSYFALREDKYLHEEADGTVSLRGCDCHGPEPAQYGTVAHSGSEHEGRAHAGRGRGLSRRKDGGRGLRPCSTYGAGQSPDSEDPRCEKDCCTTPEHSSGSAELAEDGPESASPPPPPPPQADSAAGAPAGAHAEDCREEPPEWRRGAKKEGFNVGTDLTSALLGVVQGMCCPMGLVGIAFLASLPATGVAVFLAVFLFTSAVGTGALACGWVFLTRRYMLSKSSSKMMYRASCCFTLLLGAGWILANYLGVLDTLNYAEHHHGDKQMEPMHKM